MRPFYKKLFIALLIVIVVGAIALPHISHAWCISISCMIVPPIATLVMGIVNVIQGFLALLASLFAYLIHWMIDFGSTLMTLPVVQEGFKVSLSLVNLMFIIGMIISAFQIILGVDDHHAKERIKNVIIAALLINFSFLIAGFLLDVSNIFTAFFMKNVTFTGIADAFNLSKLSNMIEPNGDITSWSGLFAMLPLALFSIAITALALIIMIAVFIQVLVRNLWVAILLTVMPLAWGCWVFPGLQEYHSRWWKEFLKQGVMVLPTITFFLYLTVATAGALGTTGASASGSGAGGATGVGDFLLNAPVLGFFTNFGSGMAIFLKVMIQMFILGGFLIGGLKMSQAAGAAGASAGLSMAKTVGGAAYKARFKVGGKEIGLQKGAQWGAGKLSSALGNLQKAPLVGGFFRAAGFGDAQNKVSEFAHNLGGEHGIDDYVKNNMSGFDYDQVRDFEPQDERQAAAKFKKLAEMGKLEKFLEDDGNNPARIQALAAAYKNETHKPGKDLKEIKELVTLRPDLAAEMYGVDSTIDPATNLPKETRTSVIQKAVLKLSAAEAGKLSSEALTPEVMQAVMDGNAQNFVRGITRDGSSALQAEFTKQFDTAKATALTKANAALNAAGSPLIANNIFEERVQLEEEFRLKKEALDGDPTDPVRRAEYELASRARNTAKAARVNLFKNEPELGNLARLDKIRGEIITGVTDL